MTQSMDIDTMRRKRDVSGLIGALSDPDTGVRLAEALGSVGDERALGSLERLKFSDPDTEVRRAASIAHALVAGRLAEKKTVESLLLKT